MVLGQSTEWPHNVLCSEKHVLQHKMVGVGLWTHTAFFALPLPMLFFEAGPIELVVDFC